MAAGELSYYLRLIEEYGNKVGRRGGAEALRRIEPEIETIEAAIRACLDSNQYPGRAVRQGIFEFMRFSGLGDDCLLRRMADAALAASDTAEAAQCLLSLGKTVTRRSKLSEGARSFEAAQAIFDSLGDTSGIADCQLWLSYHTRINGDKLKAAALIDDARRLYSAAEDILGLGHCDCATARMSIAEERIDDAADCVARALQTGRDTDSTLLLAESLLLAAEIALKMGRLGDAVVTNRQSLDIYRDCGDVYGQAGCKYQMFRICQKRGDDDSAQLNLLNALELYSKAHSTSGQALCHRRLGDAEKAKSRFAEAALHYDAAVELTAAGGPAKLLPMYLTHAGACYLDSDNLPKAEERYGRALELYSEMGSDANLALCTKLLAVIAHKQGDRPKGRSLFLQAIALNAACGSPLEEAFCLMGLANLESNAGNKSLAITQFRLASDRFASAGDPAAQGDANFREAEMLADSDPAAANERYLKAQECLQRAATAPASKLAAVCSQRLGILARQRGDFDGARASFEEAARVHREFGSTASEALAILGLAGTARQQGKWQAAGELYDRAVAMYRSIGNRNGECDCLCGSGHPKIGAGNRTAAYQHFRKALVLSREMGSKLSEGNAHIGLGALALKAYNYGEARREFQEALDLFTQTKSSLSIGSAHKYLALAAVSRSDFDYHLRAAREAWSAIGYEQGLKTLERVRQPRHRNTAVQSMMRMISRMMRAMDL